MALTPEQRERIHNDCEGLHERNLRRAAERRHRTNVKKLHTARRKGEIQDWQQAKEIINVLGLDFSEERMLGSVALHVVNGPSLVFTLSGKPMGYLR
jgi:hypothetical protein